MARMEKMEEMELKVHKGERKIIFSIVWNYQ